jgi:cobalt-zinc-cadmium resistance protein CzcA
MRRVNVAKLEVQRNEQQLKLTSTTLQSHFALAENNYLQSVKTLQYFEETANKQAESLRKASLIGYKAGELDLFRYLYNLSKSYEIETAYFDAVLQYNLSLSQLLYLKGE